MLEIALTGTPRRSIAVQTTKGTNINNYVAPDVGQLDINFYHGAILGKHPDWIHRKDATGTYNCAGMVWASRRTCLYRPEDWEIILHDDGYRLVATTEDAHIGDVVVYRSTADREIIHVARVCGRERVAFRGSTIAILYALSKWDNKCGEDVHKVDDVNLSGGTAYAIEIWTDRPAARDSRILFAESLRGM